MHKLRSAVRDEAGFAVGLTVMVMTLAALLAGVALLASQATNGAANDDRRSKRALAAAEAGLQEAAYRFTALRPDKTKCLGATGPTYEASATAGECAAVPGSVAVDAAYAYYGTPQLAAGAACADLPATAADPMSSDHCVTSSGTVGGVTRRVQARVRVPRTTIFGVIGMLGLEGVTMINSDKIHSDVGSNGLITGVNSVVIDGDLMVPNSAPPPIISGSNPTVVRQPDPWALAPADFAGSQATNNNPNLAGLSAYNAANRTLIVGSGTLNVPVGTYNLCDLWFDNSVELTVVGTGVLRLYIDSPDRPGSGCQANTGRFCLDNSVKFNLAGKPLEVYAYGSTGLCSTGAPRPSGGTYAFDGTQLASLPAHAPVVLNNSVEFTGTIHAPTSQVILTNSIKMSGGVASRRIDLGNSVEFWHTSQAQAQQPAPRDIRRLSWVECRPAPTTAGDPESGCA
jgi:hypothetical protein